MKKKSVMTKGANFSPPCPMLGITTSVAEEEHGRLEGVVPAARRAGRARAPGAARGGGQQQDDQQAGDAEEDDVLRRRHVDRDRPSTSPRGEMDHFPKGSSISRESWMWCRMSKPCSSSAACSPPAAPCSACRVSRGVDAPPPARLRGAGEGRPGRVVTRAASSQRRTGAVRQGRRHRPSPAQRRLADLDDHRLHQHRQEEHRHEREERRRRGEPGAWQPEQRHAPHHHQPRQRPQPVGQHRPARQRPDEEEPEAADLHHRADGRPRPHARRSPDHPHRRAADRRDQRRRERGGHRVPGTAPHRLTRGSSPFGGRGPFSWRYSDRKPPTSPTSTPSSRNQGSVPSFESSHLPANRKRTMAPANCRPTPSAALRPRCRRAAAVDVVLLRLPCAIASRGWPQTGNIGACEIFRKHTPGEATVVA